MSKVSDTARYTRLLAATLPTNNISWHLVNDHASLSV